MTKPYKCRVEYLESTGTQYIDTGVIGNGEFNIKYGLYANSIGSSSDIFAGARSSTQHLNFGQAASNGQFTLGYLNQYWQELSNFAINTRYDIEISYKSGEQYAIINGTKGSSKTYTGTEQTDLTIYLFKRHHYGTDNVGGLQGRIYYFTIKQNDVLVRDMIPVLDNSGRPAMYDQVSGQLFYNQGSGDDFSYGRQIIPVEYLESTGTQYIDTGIKGKNNIDFDYKCIFTNLDGTAQCVGGNWSGASSSSVSLYLGLIRTNGNFAYHYDGTSSPVVVMNTTVQDTPYTVQGRMWVGEQYMVINGTKSSVGTISSTFTSTLNMYLFGINNNGLSNPAYMKLYYCKIYDNGVLVRDYIPCIDENLTPFMFDKVNNAVYLNAGTGQFKVGPNIEKMWGGKKLRRKLALALANLKKKRKYYCEVEYLEGTGTQYIDTGLDYFADFEVGIQLRTSVSNKALGNGAFYCMQRYNQANPYWYFSTGTGTSNSYITSTPITEHHIMKWKDNKIYSDGVLLTDFTKDSNAPNRMYLYSGDGGNKYPNMIYFCKLWNPDNGELVRDFIPVLDWDMKPCLFDRVTEQLFYNQATSGDDFSYGRQIHYVDYLESTGTQYINTGLLSTASSTVDTAFSFTSMESGVANNVGVFGGRNATTTNTFTFFKIASATPQYFRFDYNSQPQVATENDMTWNTSSKYRFQYNGTNCITTNITTGESVVLTRSPGSTFTQYPIHLFAVNTAGTIGQQLSGRIYYYKYSDGTNSVDMVPAIDENGVGYMFDLVSHTIYDNAGTGAFKYPAREVDYLESDGTQYIDTGYIPNINTECSMNLAFVSLDSTYRTPFSVRTADGATNSFTIMSVNSQQTNNSFAFGSSYWSGSSVPKVVLNKTVKAILRKGYASWDGVSGNPGTSITPTNLTAYMFGRNANGTASNLFIGRIYDCQLKDNNTLVRDFIPVFQDGQAGMLDKANNVFYPNNGTSNFLTGKIVEPEYE